PSPIAATARSPTSTASISAARGAGAPSPPHSAPRTPPPRSPKPRHSVTSPPRFRTSPATIWANIGSRASPSSRSTASPIDKPRTRGKRRRKGERREVNGKMLRPTPFDVAERAGVSQSTVSRALRNSPGVNAETRARVSAAARELGYVVDRHASSLRLKSSETIALVTICRPGEDRSAINPFYFALLGSIAAATSARGFNLLVSFQENADNFRADFVASGLADAMIVIGTTSNRE